MVRYVSIGGTETERRLPRGMFKLSERNVEDGRVQDGATWYASPVYGDDTRGMRIEYQDYV